MMMKCNIILHKEVKIEAMRYLGGKSRIAKPIAEIIERERERESNAISRWQGSYSEANSSCPRERERERE